MSNSNAPKAAVYVQPDIADGDYSVEQLRKRNADQQEAANKANTSTWDPFNRSSSAICERRSLVGLGKSYA